MTKLEQLADKLEPRLRDAFLQAIRDARSGIDLDALVRMLEANDIEGALRVIGITLADFSGMSLTLRQAFAEAGIAAAKTIPALVSSEGYRVVVRFNVRNMRAERIISDQAGTLITQITEDQLTTVRNFLQRGLSVGANPRQTAIDLVGRVNRVTGAREGGVIGLASNQEQWLANYTSALYSNDKAALRALLTYELRDRRFDRSVLKAIKEERGLDPAMAAKMRTAYANRALKWRADTISRNETMKALGKAQTEAHQQAIDNGLLDPETITRYPVTAGDERVRPTHAAVPAMNREGRAWNEPFQTPFGPQMHAPYPGEINCRCHERIKINYLAPAIRQLRGAA